MKNFASFLAVAALAGATAAQAQSSISTGLGGTVIRSGGNVVTTTGAGTTTIRTFSARTTMTARTTTTRAGIGSADVSIMGNNARRTIACHGNNLLRIGTCASLSLSGSNNSVH